MIWGIPFENRKIGCEVEHYKYMLIPKPERPIKMTKLRLISLCNIGYKIISKVLCRRLKCCLPILILETQSIFMDGRLISGNILIAPEIFHGLRTNKSCQSKFMAIKTDMSKAFETSLSNRFLKIWTTCYGGLYHMWIIILSHGFYGRFRKDEIIWFSATYISTLEILFNWQNQNQHFGMRHMQN